jgi:hypothetical protein
VQPYGNFSVLPYAAIFFRLAKSTFLGQLAPLFDPRFLLHSILPPFFSLFALPFDLLPSSQLPFSLPSPSTSQEEQDNTHNQSQQPQQWRAQRWTMSPPTVSASKVRFEAFFKLFFATFGRASRDNTLRRRVTPAATLIKSSAHASNANCYSDDGARYERDDQRSASPRRDEGQESVPRRSASPGAAGDRYDTLLPSSFFAHSPIGPFDTLNLITSHSQTQGQRRLAFRRRR